MGERDSTQAYAECSKSLHAALYSRGITSVDKTENHSHTDRYQHPHSTTIFRKYRWGSGPARGTRLPRLLRVTVTQTRRILQSIVLTSCFLDGFGIVGCRHALAQWSCRANRWRMVSYSCVLRYIARCSLFTYSLRPS